MRRCDSGLAIVIPTFRRPRLLRLLLEDLCRQTLRSGALIVVDGEPGGGAARRVAEDYSEQWPETFYVPSNHANLPYQRYLGWRAAQRFERLLYLDDDLRVPAANAVEAVVQPLLEDAAIAGVTAEIRFPNSATPIQRRAKACHAPGALSVLGHRVPAAPGPEAYVNVEWLRGGVMAFDRHALRDECFSREMMALAEQGLGLGEDTLLALRARASGRFLLAREAVFEHPSADITRAVTRNEYRRGLAEALSRRLLHGDRNYPLPPQFRATARFWVAMARSAIVATARSTRRSAGFIAGAFAECPSAGDIDWNCDAAAALGAGFELEVCQQTATF